MSKQSEIEELAAKMKDGHYHCALCLNPFKTHEEKAKHMEVVHGYETLEVTCQSNLNQKSKATLSNGRRNKGS